MSMNLYFKLKGGGGYIDFPFQSPTQLTYDVLGETDMDRRLNMINQALILWEWSHEERMDCIGDLRKLMGNPALELAAI